MNTKNSRHLITVSGNLPRPGQKNPAVIVLTQPKRFGIDIADYMAAVRAAENVDFPRRYKLYDLYSDILLDTHLSSVIEKRRNAVLCATGVAVNSLPMNPQKMVEEFTRAGLI